MHVSDIKKRARLKSACFNIFSYISTCSVLLASRWTKLTRNVRVTKSKLDVQNDVYFPETRSREKYVRAMQKNNSPSRRETLKALRAEEISNLRRNSWRPHRAQRRFCGWKHGEEVDQQLTRPSLLPPLRYSEYRSSVWMPAVKFKRRIATEEATL